MKQITRTIRMLKIQVIGVNLNTAATEAKTVEISEPDYFSEDPKIALSDNIFKVAHVNVISSRNVKFSMPIKDFVELANEVKGKETNND